MRDALNYLRGHRYGRHALLWASMGALLLLSQAGYLVSPWIGDLFCAAMYLSLPWRRRDREQLITG